MTEEITHTGRIIEITPTVTTVEIVSESACSACHAKGVCGVSSAKIKHVSVPTSGWDSHAPGDEVTLVLKASMGHKAVAVAYGIPLVLLVAVLALLTLLGFSELTAGLSAISAVGAYYLCIWLFRGRLRNEYTFNIKK